MNLIELVPRDLTVLHQNSREILDRYSLFSGVNVPDILRMSHRSYDAVLPLLNDGILAIPHIRCIDFPLEKTVEKISSLVDQGLTHVLLVTGDVPTAFQETYSVSPVELTAAVKAKFPTLKVYCGLDPYRQSLAKELKYCQQKLDAGADGFFTQPFFDVALASVWMDLLRTTTLYIGVSPVLTERSYQYWVTKNHAVFPSHFELTESYMASMAQDLMALAESYGQHTYHMPIKLTGLEYAALLSA